MPGSSAAGFSLGLSFDEVLKSIRFYKTKAEDEQLLSAVHNNQSWLRFDLQSEFSAPARHSILFYKNIVSLHFEDLILRMIVLYEGYIGAYNSSIYVGSLKEEVSAVGKLAYDSGEEVYFYCDTGLEGIEFTFEADKVKSIIVSRANEK